MKSGMMILAGTLLAATMYTGVVMANGSYEDQVAIESGKFSPAPGGAVEGPMIENYMHREEVETGALPTGEAGSSDWLSGVETNRAETVDGGGLPFRPGIDAGP